MALVGVLSPHVEQMVPDRRRHGSKSYVVAIDYFGLGLARIVTMTVATSRLIAAALTLLTMTASACVGKNASPADASTQIDSSSTIDASTLAPKYMTSCVIGGVACEAGYMCYSFNAKGPHCSKTCSGPADCPAPSPGCSGMGICKVP
jgi:hypothetical protein